MSTAPLIMLLAGGTGGHVYPALALALELRSRGYRLCWIGTRRGLEDRVVPAAGIDLYTLPMRGLRGKGVVQQLTALLLLALSFMQAIWLLLRLRPRVLVGLGGYASFPAAVAGWLLRRPLLLQEQNAVAGSANRALAPLARCIATGFPGVFAGRSQARYIGNPVRAELAALALPAYDGGRPLRVLVLGGSLGAGVLNDTLPATAARLGAHCEWWHQCGRDHLAATRAAYAAHRDGVRVDAFIDDMAAAYAWADLVVCRAGALTVAELAASGRPAILVPLPQAIDDHQTANARFLSDAGAAQLLPQAKLDPGSLAQGIDALRADPPRLLAMASAARERARPRAAADLADCCEELLS
jgi:UDP-N-acetylglucosamine--N-acetylmuramyl-(pentapeptide) pyrophosphoryl-undecaprenol N-acetylglucosamine transferase